MANSNRRYIIKFMTVRDIFNVFIDIFKRTSCYLQLIKYISNSFEYMFQSIESK